MRLSAEEVAQATGGIAAGSAEFGSFHTDSRQVLPGGLFFALRGAELDGHRFLASAVERGAAGLVVSQPVEAPGAAVITVPDTWRALEDLARHVLDRVRPLVVGVTGSNGKTTTKELIAAALSPGHRVLRTEGNLNTETGLPLTLLRLQPEHTAAVLEMGMQGPGEIARLAAIAQPRVGVITGIGTVHMEFFASREDLARAKGELVQALPADGLAVLPAGDGFFELLRSLTSAPVRSFGVEAGEFSATGYTVLAGGGCEFRVRGVPVRLRLEGRHQASNAAAALAVADFAGVDPVAAAASMAEVRVGHRLEEVPGPNRSLLVDDAYNASPESMLAAFQTLAERPRQGRLLAVLGEMRELGSLAEESHRRVGRRAAEVFDEAVVVDIGSGRLLAEAAGAELVPNLEAAAAWVRKHARAGDLVLVKASNGVRLHELVGVLRA